MRYFLLMIAAVALVGGCGGKKESPEPQTNAPVQPKTEPEKETKNLQSAPTVTVNIDNPIVEKAIRKQIKKPTGELTEADLEKVAVLDLRYNELTDVSPLAGLTQLKELNLEETQLTDKQLNHLVGLTKLETLWLLNNNLTDLSALAGLTQLTYLNVNDNELTDVSALVGLKQLKLLDLQGNPDLTKAQIEELAKALPKCSIYSTPKK